MTTINSLTSLTAKTGIGGLVSGMDIDELVQGLTAASRQKILKQQQTVQKLQWKQQAYRSVIKALSEFQSSYLDVLSPTNFRSASFFNTVKATSSSAAVSVITTPSATAGTITINSIRQLATSQKITGTQPASKALSGTLQSETPGTLPESEIIHLADSLAGKSISLNLDGKVKVVTFDSEFFMNVIENPSAETLENAFQAAVDKAFGVIDPQDRIINVSIAGDHLSFTADGSQLTVRAVGDDEETLELLGLKNGQSNKINTGSALGDISFARELDDVETFKFSINSVEFEFDRSASLTEIMRKINASDAGVTLSYSSITDSFTMVAKETGAGENIKIVETDGNLMEALGLTAESGASVVYGQNALLTVNGKDIVRSTNEINIDGVTIQLHQTTEEDAEPITITLENDATSLKEPIKKFVEDYNALMDLINGYVKEAVYSDYQPLSEEQKSEMTEKQIEQWEEKAKSGVLRGDRILIGISSKLQTAMMTAAESGGISLFQIGITSSGYQENGKLKIDEAKLEEALRTRGDEIRDLFATAETGLAHRVNNIIEGAIKRTGPDNERGTLIQVAGIENTVSDTRNSISQTIERTNRLIETLRRRLTDEETRLWRRFTAMETAIQQLNVQSMMLMQFSGNNY
ncbi:MAG TPA: flagellar filament capping protein FliD [Bacillota bacterium]|nr:flagellar filament capping protein FliD [Bacillota bacterium]HQC81885.1 flagellar filament capping protein FliD [Bacillota bacterium]